VGRPTVPTVSIRLMLENLEGILLDVEWKVRQ
jgi:hypothetical protein